MTNPGKANFRLGNGKGVLLRYFLSVEGPILGPETIQSNNIITTAHAR